MLMALCALAAVWLAAYAFDNFGLGGRPLFGWWDSYRAPSGAPFTLAFKPPRPGGATERAGIRAGDVADLRDQSYAARVVLLSQPLGTQPTTLRIRRGARIVDTDLPGSAWWEGAPLWKLTAALPTLLSGIWFLACAFLIAQRRAESPQARALALVLLCLVPGFLAQTAPVWPDPTATLLSWSLTPMLGLFGSALLVRLASGYGTRSFARTLLEIATYATLASAALSYLALDAGAITLRIDPVTYYWGGTLDIALTFASGMATLVVCLVATRSVKTSERSRARWLLLPLPIAVLASTLTELSASSSNWFVGVALNNSGTILLLAGSLAVTYALLRRRVLDIGFVLSRTIVVAGVSLIVVAAFVLLEWALGSALVDVSHTTGVVANAALALVLGLSLRAIHKRVDQFVDTVFFRKRHEDEQAIGTFAREAPYITDEATLVDRARAVLTAHTDARAVELLVQNGDGRYGTIDENDPALVRLRATGGVVDLHNVASALHGDLAFPMVTRGRLIGTIVLGERRSGESYAPDERAAIAHMAQTVGTSLGVLSANGSDSLGQLRDTLTTGFAKLSRQIETLRGS